MDFSVSVKKTNAHEIVFVVNGHLDSGFVYDFEESVSQHLHENKNMIFDFDNVEYVDSSGLNALIIIQKKLAKENRSLKIIHLKDAVQSIFKVCNLHKYFDIE